jgi:hypothetical protein
VPAALREVNQAMTFGSRRNVNAWQKITPEGNFPSGAIGASVKREQLAECWFTDLCQSASLSADCWERYR